MRRRWHPLIVAAVLAATGCATRPGPVRCDGALVRINPLPSSLATPDLQDSSRDTDSPPQETPFDRPATTVPAQEENTADAEDAPPHE